MKTLSGYLNRKAGNRIDEASGQVNIGDAMKQICKVIDAYNAKTVGLAEAQLKDAKKYVEKATWQNVQKVLEKWMKDHDLGYNDEIPLGGNGWWDMHDTVVDALYKYERPYFFEVIEPDEQWDMAMNKEYKDLAKKIAKIK
jgi:hypothetical protein